MNQITELIFRKATPNDLQSILGIYAQPDLDDGKILRIAEAESIFQEIETTYSNYSIFLAIIENEIVGAFENLIVKSSGETGSFCVVEDVGVTPKFHGKGIGEQMMRFALQNAKKFGCQKFTLSSNLKREAAHRFYGNKLGFARDGYSYLTSRQLKNLTPLVKFNVSSEKEKLKNYTILKNDKPIGSFDFQIMKNLGHLGAPSAIIENLTISPEHLTDGLEKEVLSLGINMAHEAGCYKLALSHPALNQAEPKQSKFPIHGYRFTASL